MCICIRAYWCDFESTFVFEKYTCVLSVFFVCMYVYVYTGVLCYPPNRTAKFKRTNRPKRDEYMFTHKSQLRLNPNSKLSYERENDIVNAVACIHSFTCTHSDARTHHNTQMPQYNRTILDIITDTDTHTLTCTQNRHGSFTIIFTVSYT